MKPQNLRALGLLGTCFLVLTAGTFGCSPMDDDPVSENGVFSPPGMERVAGMSLEAPCGEPTTVPLMVGKRNKVVGSVSVTNDGDLLEVTYQMDEGWELYKTHLAVVGSFDEFPTNRRGNAKKRRFPMQSVEDPTVSERTFSVELASLGLGAGDTFFVSAQAGVGKIGRRNQNRWRGAWAEGEHFLEGRRPTYFTGTVGACDEPPEEQGVCCLGDVCEVQSAEDCAEAGGVFQFGATCDPGLCASGE